MKLTCIAMVAMLIWKVLLLRSHKGFDVFVCMSSSLIPPKSTIDTTHTTFTAGNSPLSPVTPGWIALTTSLDKFASTITTAGSSSNASCIATISNASWEDWSSTISCGQIDGWSPNVLQLLMSNCSENNTTIGDMLLLLWLPRLAYQISSDSASAAHAVATMFDSATTCNEISQLLHMAAQTQSRLSQLDNEAFEKLLLKLCNGFNTCLSAARWWTRLELQLRSTR
jgi:hypothetical protein